VAPAGAHGFLQASDALVILPTLKHLCNNCLTQTKEAFFISATAHVNVISQVCSLTTEEMIKMRGWAFLKTKSPDGSPCHHQTFSNSECETIQQGVEMSPPIMPILSAALTKSPQEDAN
jgi:hypothetical protein